MISGSPSARARAAVLAVLADEANGFNSRVQANLTGEGLTAFSVDFGPKSRTFFQGYIDRDSEAFDYSILVPNPCAMCLFTTGAVDGKQVQTATNIFSGFVEVGIDCYLKFRQRSQEDGGIETSDTESVIEAVEAALLWTFHEQEHWGDGGVAYNRDFKADRGALLMYEDGYQQRISITLAVRVNI